MTTDKEIQFGLTRGDSVVTDLRGDPILSDYCAEKPAPRDDGFEWLPVINRDVVEFDIQKHYRLAPRYAVENGFVLRLYPVIDREDA
jgi:hypothetical protein